MMPVLVMPLSISLSHCLLVETTSVSQVSTLGYGLDFIQVILSGMVRAVPAVAGAAHSTVLHISLNNSPVVPLMILRLEYASTVLLMILP